MGTALTQATAVTQIDKLDHALWVTGTDTGVGKTIVTAALAAYWQTYRRGQRLGLMKPIQSGLGDREYYQQHFDLDQTPETYNPLFFEAPLAPPLAADLAGQSIDLGAVWRPLTQLLSQRDFVLIEALGGLGSPVTHELTVADLAAQWCLPTLLVVPVKLGSIAQAVANAALARQTQLSMKGIVLNCLDSEAAAHLDRWAPIPLIESLTHLPVLGVMPPIANSTALAELAEAACQLELDAILPARV